MIRNLLFLAVWTMCFCASPNLHAQSYNLDRLSISGFTEPYRSIDVAATDTGTVSNVEVTEGQKVEAGDLLARLNEDVYAASLGMAKEKLQAKGRLHSAEAEMKMQENRFTKLLGLYQRGNASQTEVNLAKTQLDIAMANVETVADDGRIAAFEHKRAAAQLELRRVRSPINGVVTRVHKEAGEFVSPNDPIVVSVVQLHPLKSIFSVPQTATKQLRAEDQVDILMGSDRTPTTGVVEFVSPTTDAQSGTQRVSITIDNRNGQWQSGDSCVLHLSNSAVGRPRNAAATQNLRLVTTGESN